MQVTQAGGMASKAELRHITASATAPVLQGGPSEGPARAVVPGRINFSQPVSSGTLLGASGCVWGRDVTSDHRVLTDWARICAEPPLGGPLGLCRAARGLWHDGRTATFAREHQARPRPMAGSFCSVVGGAHARRSGKRAGWERGRQQAGVSWGPTPVECLSQQRKAGSSSRSCMTRWGGDKVLPGCVACQPVLPSR